MRVFDEIRSVQSATTEAPGSVDRRRAVSGLLAGAAALIGGGVLAGCSTTADGVQRQTSGVGTAGPPSMLETRDPDLHILRRLTYGPTTTDVDAIRTAGAQAWLDKQLDPEDLDTAGVDNLLNDVFPELGQPAAGILEGFRADGDGIRLATVLPASLLHRHVRSPAQLYERMVEFWGDHFNVPQIGPPSTATRIAMDREVLRPHALGRFDELLIASAQSPAMLLYLDNVRSTVDAINENYARELLELHTVGVDGGYGEADIVGVARLLTGWSFTRELEFRFRPRRHDAGPVSVLGWERPAGGDLLEHGVQFLHHLARLPQTAGNVCRKLAIRFVADDPDQGLVEDMADAWTAHDTAIAPVIRAMVTHPAFADAPPKFNRPWDFLVQTLRSVDASIDIGSPLDRRRLSGLVQGMGQPPFRHASPDGYPDSETAWLNAGGLLARWNLVMALTLPADRPLHTGLDRLVDETLGSSAIEVFEQFAARLRHEALADDQLDLLTRLLGWTVGQVPSAGELDDAAPTIAFAVLAHPRALYR